MFGGFGRALSSPHYRLYACGHIANVFGWWGNRLGIGWLTWELTGSAGWLGIVAFAGMIPVTVVSPFAGVLADRHGHRQMAILAGVFGGSVSLALAFLTIYGETTIPVLIGLSILQGVAFGTEFPARQALIPQLCKRENLSAALAFNATTFQVGTFVGPVLAGFLITRWGTGASIMLFAATNYWMALMILFIRFRPKPRDLRDNRGFLTEIAGGFRYIADTPSLRLLFMIAFTSGLLLRPYTELLPGFSGEIFGSGPEGLAALTAAAGFGALTCGLLLVFRGRAGGLVNIMLGGAICGSIMLAVFAAMNTLNMGIVVLATASFLILACHVGAYSLIQNSTDAEMRGRVISVNVSISIGGPALGALMIGWLAEAIGLQWAVTTSALLALAIILIMFPKVRRAALTMEAE